MRRDRVRRSLARAAGWPWAAGSPWPAAWLAAWLGAMAKDADRLGGDGRCGDPLDPGQRGRVAFQPGEEFADRRGWPFNLNEHPQAQVGLFMRTGSFTGKNLIAFPNEQKIYGVQLHANNRL